MVVAIQHQQGGDSDGDLKEGVGGVYGGVGSVGVPVFAQPILLGVFPTMKAAQQALGISPTASQSSVVLPQGRELGDGGLLQTDGKQALLYAFDFLAFGMSSGVTYWATTPAGERSLGQAIRWGIAGGLFAVGIDVGHDAYHSPKKSTSSNSDPDQDDQGFYPSGPLAVQHQSYSAFTPMVNPNKDKDWNW